MYGYIFAIIGGIVILLLSFAIFTVGPLSRRKKTSEDYRKGTSYEEPLAEQPDLSEPRVSPTKIAKPSKTSTGRNDHA